jgi:hypothetical protein
LRGVLPARTRAPAVIEAQIRSAFSPGRNERIALLLDGAWDAQESSMPKLWNRKPIATLQAEAAIVAMQELMAHGGVPLKRTLSATSLMALGIGNIIGAGIFVLTGQPPRPMPGRPSAFLF